MLSRRLGSRPARHRDSRRRRDTGNAADGTLGLKALAQLVIARDNRRYSTRDNASRPVSKPCPQRETAGTPETGAILWWDNEDERAAIVEHDGAIPRAWAEGFARLNPDRPPADVPAMEWRRFVNDVGLFLDGPFCSRATNLGWGSFDLFGCDCDRPFERMIKRGFYGC